MGVILLLLGSGVVTTVLVEGAEMTEQIYAFDLGGISNELVQRIHAAEPPSARASGFEAASSQGAPPVVEPPHSPSPGFEATTSQETPLPHPPPEPQSSEHPPGFERSQLSTAFVAAANLAWVAVGAGVVWWRYRRLALSR